VLSSTALIQTASISHRRRTEESVSGTEQKLLCRQRNHQSLPFLSSFSYEYLILFCLVIAEEQENQYQEQSKSSSAAKETAKASHFYPPFLMNIQLYSN